VAGKSDCALVFVAWAWRLPKTGLPLPVTHAQLLRVLPERFGGTGRSRRGGGQTRLVVGCPGPSGRTGTPSGGACSPARSMWGGGLAADGGLGAWCYPDGQMAPKFAMIQNPLTRATLSGRSISAAPASPVPDKRGARRAGEARLPHVPALRVPRGMWMTGLPRQRLGRWPGSLSLLFGGDFHRALAKNPGGRAFRRRPMAPPTRWPPPMFLALPSSREGRSRFLRVLNPQGARGPAVPVGWWLDDLDRFVWDRAG